MKAITSFFISIFNLRKFILFSENQYWLYFIIEIKCEKYCVHSTGFEPATSDLKQIVSINDAYTSILERRHLNLMFCVCHKKCFIRTNLRILLHLTLLGQCKTICQ